jgi:Transcriptional regulators
MELNNSTLHYVIIDTLLTRGRAPSVAELAERFDVSRPRVGEALHDLAEYHGVVLHPDSGEVWVVHPFSTAPTGFLVRAGEHECGANCGMVFAWRCGARRRYGHDHYGAWRCRTSGDSPDRG